MASNSSQPVVSGVRPNFGHYETPIDIRGTNLGFSKEDVKSVKICGVECIAQAKWVSQSHIKCVNLVVTAEEVTGEIIVTTFSGGEGTSDGPQFTAHPPKDGSGLQSKYWEGDDKFVIRFGRTKETVVETPLAQKERDLLCLYEDLNMTERSSISQLQKMLPNATKNSGDVKSEDFDPVFYILQNHASTKLEQLKQGQTLLNGLIDKQQKGPVEHLKKNMSQIVECNDIIQSIARPLREDPSLTPDNLTGLCDKVKKVNTETQQLFSGVLQRKDESDSMRNALNVLMRFNFLFSVPKAIEANLKLERYDLILKDFEHAMTLLERNEDHPVFETVQRQIFDQILRVKRHILSLLLEVPKSLDLQVRMTGYLTKLGLEEDEDPAWDCLVKMSEHVMFVLNKCREVYCDYENNSLAVEVSVTEPIKTVFIKEISELFKQNMAMFLDMGEAYKASGSEKSGSKITQFYNNSSLPTAFLKNSLDNFQTFVSLSLNMTKLFVNHMMKALDSKFEQGDNWAVDEHEGSNEHLMAFLAELRSVVEFFSDIKSPKVPKQVLDSLTEQLTRMRKYCFEKLLQNAIDELELYEEKWRFCITDAGFESTSLTEIVGVMTNYLSLVHQTNHPFREKLEAPLWASLSKPEKTHFVQVLVQFFTIVAEKYYEVATDERFTSDSSVLQVVKQSNITSVSCFTTVNADMLFIALLRNITFLSSFLNEEFTSNGFPDLPTESIAAQCMKRFNEIYAAVQNVFKKHAFQVFRSVTLDTKQPRPGTVSEIYKTSYSVDHTKVTKLGRLFLHQLVRDFAYLKTIHPKSVQSLFAVVIGQLTSLIKKYSASLEISYTDLQVIVRLVAKYILPEDLKFLEELMNKFGLLDTQMQAANLEIETFLDKNRFHFISFSG